MQLVLSHLGAAKLFTIVAPATNYVCTLRFYQLGIHATYRSLLILIHKISTVTSTNSFSVFSVRSLLLLYLCNRLTNSIRLENKHYRTMEYGCRYKYTPAKTMDQIHLRLLFIYSREMMDIHSLGRNQIDSKT